VGIHFGEDMYFFRETKTNQLVMLEQIARNLQQVNFDEDVSEVINKAMNGKLSDLQDILDTENKTAFTYGTDTEAVVLTIVRQAVDCVLLEYMAKQMIGTTFNEAYAIAKRVIEEVKKGLKDPTEYSGEIHFCSECGKLMREGFSLVDEFFCSDECLNKHYTTGEYLAMYAGLDNTDPSEVQRAEDMSPEELEKSNGENGSLCCYTEWEVEV
jgi:rubrerythrin